jgi:hypothetical protein
MCAVAMLSASTLATNTLALVGLVGKSKSSVDETLQKIQWAASAPMPEGCVSWSSVSPIDSLDSWTTSSFRRS